MIFIFGKWNLNFYNLSSGLNPVVFLQLFFSDKHVAVFQAAGAKVTPYGQKKQDVAPIPVSFLFKM
jgi:hypothetical protein